MCFSVLLFCFKSNSARGILQLSLFFLALNVLLPSDLSLSKPWVEIFFNESGLSAVLLVRSTTLFIVQLETVLVAGLTKFHQTR